MLARDGMVRWFKERITKACGVNNRHVLMFCERGGIEKYVICSLDRFVFQLSNDKFSDELFFLQFEPTSMSLLQMIFLLCLT